MKKLYFLFCFVPQLLMSQSIDHWESVVTENSVWKYTIPDATTPVNWIQPAFNATAWPSGTQGMGYGDGDDNTILPNGTVSVYMRHNFNIVDTSQIEQAILHVDFDDGFVAYINGVEVARMNMNGTGQPLYSDLANAQHEAMLYQGLVPDQFVLNKSILNTCLRNGTNVITLETHNQSSGSSDLSSLAVLSVGIDNPTVNYSPTPSWFVAPFNFSSSNLPIMVINTNSQTIVDNPKITVDMGLIYNGPGNRNYLTDPYNNYNGLIAIEIRGSSSQMFPKKGYGLETRDALGANLNVSLLGLPAENDWVLHGPYSDKSLMRNYLTYRFGTETGQYAPRTRFLELVINNEYLGVYLLVEKIKQDNNRVDIAKLNPQDTLGDELTGGYILKIDKFTGGGQSFSSPYAPFTGATQTVNFIYHDPDGAVMHPLQKNYIQNFISNFETTLNGPNFADPVIGVRAYADLSSFIDYFLANELTRNVDGYRLSTFMYKDKNSNDSLLKMGPLWDFNLAFGNADYCAGGNTTGWAYQFYQVCSGDGWQIPFWWERLMQDPQFTHDLKCRYLELRTGVMSTTYIWNVIDSVAAELNESQLRNFQKWPVLNQYVWPNNYVGNTYANEIAYLKTWIADRLTWMDANMPGSCPNLTVNEINGSSKMEIYPNPTNDFANIKIDEWDAENSQLIISDIRGKVIVQRYITSNLIHIETAGLPNGVYLVSLVNQSAVSEVKKMVISH